MRTLIILAAIVSAIGCGNEETIAKFPEQKARILRDEKTGERFAVAHHIGNTYTVKPID